MALLLLGKRIGVSKIKKLENKNDGFLVMPQAEEYFGTVNYVGLGLVDDTTVNVGDKVYFGTKFQSIRLSGSEICVMDADNVLAVLRE